MQYNQVNFTYKQYILYDLNIKNTKWRLDTEFW